MVGLISKVSRTQRSLHIRPWDGFKSTAHVLAIVRELEKRLGPAEFIHVPRESDDLARYKPYGWITFAERIDDSFLGKAKYRLLEVPEPKVDLSKPGGIGLADLIGITQPREKAPEASQLLDDIPSPTPKKNIIDVRVGRPERNGVNIRDLRPNPLFRSKRGPLSQGLSQFGGFATTPTPEVMAIQEKWKKHAVASNIPVQEVNMEEVDPLAGYLDLVKETETVPTKNSSSSEPVLDRLSGPEATSPSSPSETTSAYPILSIHHVKPQADRHQNKATQRAPIVAEQVPETTPPVATSDLQNPKLSKRDHMLKLARERGVALERQKQMPAEKVIEEIVSGSDPQSEPDSAPKEEGVAKEDSGIGKRLWSLMGRT